MTQRRKFTKSERTAIYAKCNAHCAYCGKQMPISEMQVDHMNPIRRGGTNDMDNLMPSCRSCNHFKDVFTLEGFRKAVGGWCAVLMRDSVTYRNAVRFGQVMPTPKPVIFYFERMNRPMADAAAPDAKGTGEKVT